MATTGASETVADKDAANRRVSQEISISLREGTTLDPVVKSTIQPQVLAKFVYFVPTVEPSDLFTFIFKKTRVPRTGELPDDYSNVVFTLPLNPIRERRSQEKELKFILTSGGYLMQSWGNGLINMTFEGTTGRLVPGDDVPESDRKNFGEITGDNSFAANSPNLFNAFGLYKGTNSPNLFNAFGLYKGSGGDQSGKNSYRLPLTVRNTQAWLVFSKFNHFYQYFNGGNEIAMASGASGDISGRSAVTILSFWDRVFVGALTRFAYDVDANDPWQIKYSFDFKALPMVETVGSPTPISILSGSDSKATGE